MSRLLHRVVILAALCLLLPGSTRSAHAEGRLEQGVVSVPLEVVPGYTMPFLRVKLDDGNSYLLALELGVPQSNLDAALVQKNNLKVGKEKLSDGETADVVRTGMHPTPLSSATSGGMLTARFVVANLTEARARVPEMAGRLGADLLTTMAIRLDFSKKQIDFMPGGNLPGGSLEPKGAQRIPLQVEHDLVLVEGQIDGRPTRFMLSCLDQSVLRSPKTLAALTPLYRLQHTEDPKGVLAPDSQVRLQEIRVGNVVWKQRVVAQMAASAPDIPDVLSLDLLSHFRVTIDVPSRSLYLEPDPAGNDQDVQYFGLGVLPRRTADGHLIIASISVPSPASEAKLRVGDEIVAINGLAVATGTPEKIAAEAGKPEGSVVAFSILRKGERKPREYKLTVRRLL